MQIRTTFPVKQIAGHDGYPGGMVYFTIMGLQCARRWVKPDNPQTDQQKAIRNYLTLAAQDFKNISDAQRAAWASWCANHTKTYLGEDFVLQEMAAFVWINTIRQIDGQAIERDAPTKDAGFTASGISNVAFVSSTNTLSFDVTHNGSAGVGSWLIRITPTLASAQRNPRKSDWRLAAGINTKSIVAVDDSPQSISVVGALYSYENNDYMAIQLVPLSDDYVPGAEFTWKGQISVS